MIEISQFGFGFCIKKYTAIPSKSITFRTFASELGPFLGESKAVNN